MPSHDLKRLARHHIELSWNKGRMALVCGEVTVLTHAKRGMDRLEPL